MTTREPGARLVLTQGFTLRPLATAFRASSPAATITDGFEVLVQLVIAAITTDPSESSPLWPFIEMGTGLATRRGKTLYAFWGARLAAYANQLTAGHSDRTVVVCASSEYSKALRTHKLAGPVITPVFKEEHNGKLSVISFYAKQARGMLARYLVDERLTTPEGLKAFDRGGYRFDPELSSADEWVFWRPKPTPKGK